MSPLAVALLAAAGIVLLAIDPVAWAGLLVLAIAFALALELDL